MIFSISCASSFAILPSPYKFVTLDDTGYPYSSRFLCGVTAHYPAVTPQVDIAGGCDGFSWNRDFKFRNRAHFQSIPEPEICSCCADICRTAVRYLMVIYYLKRQLDRKTSAG